MVQFCSATPGRSPPPRRSIITPPFTHKIDGICFFAESEPDKVFARLEDGFDDWDRYRGDGGKLLENDPSANGFILFKNGVQAHYCGDKEAFQDSSYLLVGKKGQITVTPWGAVQDRTAELVTNDSQTGEAVRKTLVPGQYLVRNLGAAIGNWGGDRREGRRERLAGQGGAQDGADHGGVPQLSSTRIPAGGCARVAVPMPL